MTSFRSQVLFASARVYMQQILYDKFSYVWQVLFTGANVSTSSLWHFISSQLANRIKCSDYFDKFSLLTHTDEQNLYFDIFSMTSALVQKLAC
jgi:hypothetical protein